MSDLKTLRANLELQTRLASQTVDKTEELRNLLTKKPAVAVSPLDGLRNALKEVNKNAIQADVDAAEEDFFGDSYVATSPSESSVTVAITVTNGKVTIKS